MVELLNTRSTAGQSATEWNKTRLAHPDSSSLSSKWCHGIDCEQATFPALFRSRKRRHRAAESNALIKAQTNRPSCAMLHDREQFSSRPTDFHETPELRAQSAGANLRNQDLNRAKPLPCRLMGRRPASSPLDASRLKPGPAYDSCDTLALKGSTICHSSAVGPCPTCLGSTSCTARTCLGWICAVARARVHLSCADCADPCARDNLFLCGRQDLRGASFCRKPCRHAACFPTDAELERLRLPRAETCAEPIWPRLAASGRWVPSERWGIEGMGPFLLTPHTGTGLRQSPWRVAAAATAFSLRDRRPDPPIKQLIQTAE